MATLGIDYGEARIGLAVTDDAGLIASPIGSLKVDGALEAALKKIVAEKTIDKIVLGLPLSESGEEGPSAHRARSFAGRLKKWLALEVEFEDERYTTADAIDMLKQEKPKVKQAKGARDAMAAALILRSWMERTTSSGENA